MRRVPFAAIFAIAWLPLGAGCGPSAAELRARADAETARAELVRVRAELDAANAALARAGIPAPPSRPPAPVKQQTLEEELTGLKKAYDSGAVNSGEWTTAKARCIEQTPSAVPVNDTRSLGKRLIGLKVVHDNGAINSSEWAKAKDRYIKQAPLRWRRPFHLRSG